MLDRERALYERRGKGLRSHGIGHVEKDVAHAETLGQMLAQPPHSEGLRGVVAGGDEV
jgi:hypothetical protein